MPVHYPTKVKILLKGIIEARIVHLIHNILRDQTISRSVTFKNESRSVCRS